jgi:hypothetical protein
MGNGGTILKTLKALLEHHVEIFGKSWERDLELKK